MSAILTKENGYNLGPCQTLPFTVPAMWKSFANPIGLIFILLLCSHPATAADILVDDAWARATPPGARTGAVYLTINNAGEDDRLVAASSHAAEEVQIHSHVHEDGMMTMEQLPSLDIPGSGQAVLKPGGHHLMLVGLASGLTAGHSIHVQLEFASAGPIQVTVPIRDARGDR